MIQTITFQNCLNPALSQDFDVDTSVILSGDTIFADYQCWESTGNVGVGPSGTVIFTGYTTCQQCNDDFNGYEFEHCQTPGVFIYFGLKNSEVNQYFESTGATISYDGTCYNYIGVYEQGTGSTTYNYTVSELISTNALFTNCNNCLNPPSPTPTPTPTPTPALCYSGVTDSASWYYTDCCGVYHSGSLSPTYICYDPNYPISGVDTSGNNPCSVVCPSVTPTPTPTLTQTPSITPSLTPSITSSVTPSVTPSITPSVTPSVSTTIGVSPSITPSLTPSVTPSLTPSVTPSLTPSLTPSVTITPTPTPSSGCTQFTFTLQSIYFLTQAGPYNISGTTTGGTIVLIATGITNTQLLSGYTTTVCGSITGGTIQSVGSCTNSVTYLVATPLPVPSLTPTPSVTKTPTPTKTVTPSLTPSITPTKTPSITPTPTKTPTPTPTVSSSIPNVTPSITPTKTPTPTLTSTPTKTPSVTPTPSFITITTLRQHDKLNSCSKTFGNIQKNGTTFYTWNTGLPTGSYSGTTTMYAGDVITLSMDALGLTSECTSLGYNCSTISYSIVRNGVTVQTNTESSCGTGSINDTYTIPGGTTSLIIYITSDVTT